MENNNIKGVPNLKSKKSAIIASFIGLFLISVGASLAVFYYVFPGSASTILSEISKKTKINVNLPKTEECPINGAMYTKAESEIWNSRRPIVAMIENHVDARPLFGISYADVVYEAVAEGGITRTMDIFYCGAAAYDVKAAPIRSARVYFINLAAGYGTDPLYLHQGGANNICSTCPGGVKPRSQIDPTVNTVTLLAKLGWAGGTTGNNLDGGYNIGYPEIVTAQNRLGADITLAQEHSRVADLNLLWEQAADKRGLGYKDSEGVPWTQGFRKWLFQDGKASTSPTATDIKFDFWSSMPGYDVEWKYDATSNSYTRFNGGQPFVDFVADKQQITAKNVVIMFVDEKGPVDSELHMFYKDIGTGDALIFQNGEVIKGTWKKASELDREVFYDTNGNEVKMVRGATWIELVPSTNKVTY